MTGAFPESEYRNADAERQGMSEDYMASRRSQLADAARRDAEAEAAQATREVNRGALERRSGGDWVTGHVTDSHGRQLQVVSHSTDALSIKDGAWTVLAVKRSKARELIAALERAVGE